MAGWSSCTCLPQQQWTYEDGLLCSVYENVHQCCIQAVDTLHLQNVLAAYWLLCLAGWSSCTGLPQQQWTYEDGLLYNVCQDACLHMQRYCTLFDDYSALPLSQPGCVPDRSRFRRRG